MYKSQSFAAFGVLPSGLLVASIMFCGCEKAEKISTYTVPKHESLQTPTFQADFERRHPKPKRMIGVVIPRGTALWFFKLEGAPEAVAARENDVREFLKSLHFAAAEKLEWALPPGWQQLPRTEMRYATLVLDGEPPLEMTVTQFPARPDLPISEQVVSNINRWRNQLSLPPIEEDDLGAQSEKLSLDDSIAYWINIVGRPKAKPAAMSQPQRQVAPPNHEIEPVGPAYEKPEGWVAGKPSKISVVSLQAIHGDASVAITVTKAGGDRLANVNRWRGQLKLAPFTAEELAASAKKVEVGKIPAEQYDMTNAERTIFGVIAEDRGQTWFVKLDGNADLAERERPGFEAFLKSLRLD